MPPTWPRKKNSTYDWTFYVVLNFQQHFIAKLVAYLGAKIIDDFKEELEISEKFKADKQAALDARIASAMAKMPDKIHKATYVPPVERIPSIRQNQLANKKLGRTDYVISELSEQVTN